MDVGVEVEQLHTTLSDSELLICCKAAGANIMRVGSRTDNEEIAKHTMYQLRASVKIGGPWPEPGIATS